MAAPAASSASRSSRRCPSSRARASSSCSTRCCATGKPFASSAATGLRCSAGRAAAAGGGVLQPRLRAAARRRRPVDGDRRGRHRRDRAGAERASRGAERGEPRQGRVPGHARPRAAQPARADPHRAAAHAAARHRTSPERERAIIERQVQHLVAPGRRPARRLAHHPRQGRAASASRWSWPTSWPRRVEIAEPAARAAAPPARRVDVPSARLHGRRRSGAAGAGGRQPADQRRQVHRPGGHIRVQRAAATAARSSCQRPRRRASASTPRCCRASSTCSCRSARRSTARRAASGSGWRIVRSLVELHGGAVAAESDGPGRGQHVHACACRCSRHGDAGSPAGRRVEEPPARSRGPAAHPGRRRQRRRRREHAPRCCELLGYDVARRPRRAGGAAARAGAPARRRAPRHRAAGDGRLRARPAAAVGAPGVAAGRGHRLRAGQRPGGRGRPASRGTW